MKKMLLIALLLNVTLLGFSQNKLSIFGGPQLTTAKFAVNGHNQKTDFKFGFQAGSTIKIPVENNLYFAPAIFYSLKGYKVNFDRPSLVPDTNAINNNTTIHTLEVAILVQFDLSSQPDHFYIKVGPSIDFQLFGHEKFTKKDNSIVSRNMQFGFGDYGHYAASLIGQFGYETKHGLSIFAQYGHGVGNISNVDTGPSVAHRAISLSIGKVIYTSKH